MKIQAPADYRSLPRLSAYASLLDFERPDDSPDPQWTPMSVWIGPEGRGAANISVCDLLMSGPN